jgi:hypothetical protein
MLDPAVREQLERYRHPRVAGAVEAKRGAHMAGHHDDHLGAAHEPRQPGTRPHRSALIQDDTELAKSAPCGWKGRRRVTDAMQSRAEPLP